MALPGGRPASGSSWDGGVGAGGRRLLLQDASRPERPLERLAWGVRRPPEGKLRDLYCSLASGVLRRLFRCWRNEAREQHEGVTCSGEDSGPLSWLYGSHATRCKCF